MSDKTTEDVCLHWSYPAPVPKRPYDSHLGLNLAHISWPNDTDDPSSTGYRVWISLSRDQYLHILLLLL